MPREKIPTLLIRCVGGPNDGHLFSIPDTPSGRRALADILENDLPEYAPLGERAEDYVVNDQGEVVFLWDGPGGA